MQVIKSLEQSGQRLSLLGIVGRFWAWLFLLSLITTFSITGNGFFSFFNLQSIGANMAIALLISLGETFVIIAGGIDLSTGFVMGLAAVTAAKVITLLGPHLPFPLVIALGILAGIAVGVMPGLINGILIGRLQVPPFIVTLGMLGIARGVGFLLSGGQPVSVQVEGVGHLGNGYLLYFHPELGVSFFRPPTGLSALQIREMTNLLPYPLILALIAVAVCYWLLKHTRFGQHTYAIGGSREAARRAGIPVVRHTIAVYMLSALLASIAGLLYVFRFTNGAANAGDPLLLDSIAAVVIGGASLFGGEGTIIGTLIGALIISVIQNGLVILGIDPFWQFVAVGTVIILAVLIDQAKTRIVK